MKRKDLKTLLKNFELVKHVRSTELAYAIMKNSERILKELKIFEKTFPVTEEIQQFENKRIELLLKFCKKDEKGNPVIIEERYQFEKELDANNFSDELNKLKNEYPSIEEREKEIKNFLEQETDVKLHMVKLHVLPTNLNHEEFIAIKDIIEE